MPYNLYKALESNNSVLGFGLLWQTAVNLQALWQHHKVSLSKSNDNNNGY
jgi:hypothetical protein